MGEAHRAFDTSQKRAVALKLLPVQLSGDAEFRARERRPLLWCPRRCTPLRTDLDAVFLPVYGLTRPKARHMLYLIPVERTCEKRDRDEVRTECLLVEAYDRMATTTGSDVWAPLAPVPAGHGPRHPRR